MSRYADEYVRTFSALLQEGYNTTIECPDCGQDNLSAKKENGTIAYHCWRATCGIKGYVHLYGREAMQADAAPPKQTPVYTGPINKLTEAEANRLGAKFRLTRATVDAYVRKSFARYLLPICTRQGQVRGLTIRKAWEGTELAEKDYSLRAPKSEIFGSGLVGPPLQSWYRSMNGDIIINNSYPLHCPASRIVLVEDQISAMRIAQDVPGCDAVALLGVGLNAEKVADIQADKKSVVIALDADATRTAFNHARRWGAAFRSCRVVVLTKDIKDLTEQELKDVDF